MKLLFVLGLLIVALAVVQGEVGAPCTSQDQCAADECCEIINIIVASRRRQVLVGPNTDGTCQKLKLEGESCSNIAVMNGYCGCAAGLHCTPIVSTTLRGKRRELPSHCTKA